jgi:hypothetical protein
MKKKTVKKLVLAKETVRALVKSHVRGGETGNTCGVSYTCGAMDSCMCSASCDWTCTCNSNVFACPITAGDSCIGC